MKLIQKIIKLFRPSRIMYGNITISMPSGDPSKLRGLKFSEEKDFSLKCIYGYKNTTEMDIEAIHESIATDVKLSNSDIVHIQIPLEYSIHEIGNRVIPMKSEIHFVLSKNGNDQFVAITIPSSQHDMSLEDLIKEINTFKALYILENSYDTNMNDSFTLLSFYKYAMHFFKEYDIEMRIFNSDLEKIVSCYPI